MALTLEKIRAARGRIAPYIITTPLLRPTRVTVEKSPADALVANMPGSVCFPYVAKNGSHRLKTNHTA